MTAERDPWFHRENTSAPRARLICIPPAGAGAQFFRGWGNALPAHVELLATRLPGREGRGQERPLHRVRDLLPLLDAAVRRYADVPYAFYGHSMGSLLAVLLTETARRSGRAGPRGLIVSGRRPPHVSTDRPPMHTMDDAALWDHLHDIGGLHPRIWKETDLQSVLLPAVRADLTLVEQFRYETDAPLDVPIHVLRATDDPLIDDPSMAAWADRTTRPLVVKRLPGGHFFMNDHKDAFLAALADSVRTLVGEDPVS